LTISGEDEEPTRAVNVERVVHQMIGALHRIDQADLDSVADAECPRDLVVLGARISVNELPDHVARVRLPIDLRHEVLPLKAVTRVLVMVMVVSRDIGSSERRSRRR
jgi:hypothetical protein